MIVNLLGFPSDLAIIQTDKNLRNPKQHRLLTDLPQR